MACGRVCLILQRRLATSAAAERVSAAEVRSWRSTLFSKEQERQRSLYPRIEKIEVTMQGAGVQGTLLVMNKGLSTPYSCSRHLTDWHVSSAALALVDGEPWHLHRPLTRSCSLTLLTFKDANPQLPNQAYWRSCAALLGQVLDGAFKEEYIVKLLKIPEVPVTAGAFCCDFVLDPQLDAWTPTEESLRSFTRDANQLIHQNLPWEPLEVAPPVALEIFSHSRCKQEEVEEKAAQSPNGTVSLYRCGHHVVLAGGPLVARTGLCSQYEVTALHTVGEGPWGLQRRAQGLSLPVNLTDLWIDNWVMLLRTQQPESERESTVALALSGALSLLHQLEKRQSEEACAGLHPPIVGLIGDAHHTVWRRLRQRAEKLVQIHSSAASVTETTPTSSEATPSPSQP